MIEYDYHCGNNYTQTNVHGNNYDENSVYGRIIIAASMIKIIIIMARVIITSGALWRPPTRAHAPEMMSSALHCLGATSVLVEVWGGGFIIHP